MSANVKAILKVVRAIPEGRVATYGQVASLAGIPRNARQVGTVLRDLPEDSNVPWHRVVNAAGRISSCSQHSVFEGLQRHLLEEEGVTFEDVEQIDLAEYRWDGESR